MLANDKNDESPLERLRNRLYAPKAVDGVGAAGLSAQTPSAPQAWKQEPVPVNPPKKLPVASIFLFSAAGFFLIAGIITVVVLFLGGRSLSADHLTITTEGSTNVAGGDPLSVLITVTNDNPLPVTDATLTVDFPEGTVDPDAPSVSLTHHTETIGTLTPGQSVRVSVRAAFFGAENQRISLPIMVEYTTDNSNATFTKKASHDFTLSTSPVSLSVSTLSEISSGQALTVVVRVRSNADAPLSNVAVQAAYPFGFSVKEATPTGPLFVLGTMNPGEEKEIRVTGTVSGQDGDERVFRFTSGALPSADARNFSVSYSVADAIVRIAKPFLTVGLSLNREDTPTIVVRPDESVDGSLSWNNALATPIENARISVTVAGDAFDTGSAVATGGFFRSADRTFVFDSESNPALARLQPGDTGNATFQYRLKSGDALAALRNPSMTVTVSVSGRRIVSGQVAQDVTSTITRTVKVASALSLSSRIVRTTGAFSNTGPWPPQADTETTYTVELSAANSVNSVANSKAVMKLPSYVRFVTGTGFTFNEATREVTWNVGDLGAGMKKDGSFQIAFLPSASQKGTSPVLVMEQKFTGYDRFVQQELSASAPSLTTQTTSDPGYQIQYGSVQ